MGAKKWFRNQFRAAHLVLRHDDASEFYLSCWQKNRSPLPLICVRLVLFLACVGTLAFSFTIVGRRDLLAYWAIYFTQWGLVMNFLTTGLAIAVSLVAYFRGPIDSTFGLPWYVKLYYGVYCTALPCAFFITIFYYSFLANAAFEAGVEINPVLDVLIHGINSVIQFCLMATSKQPLQLVQFVFPVGILLVYMTFSIIYHFAGGTDPYGGPIYPPLDWANPGPTVGLVFLCILLVMGTTSVAVTFTLLRNCASRKFNSDTSYALSG